LKENVNKTDVWCENLKKGYIMNKVIKSIEDRGVKVFNDEDGTYRSLYDILEEISTKYKNGEISEDELTMLCYDMAEQDLN